MNYATKEEAYHLLDSLKISYTRMDHPPIFSAKELAPDFPGPKIKNLLLRTKKHPEFYLVILPDEKELPLKLLAEKLATKRLSFASEEDLFRLLRVPKGTVTPLALPNDHTHAVTVIIDHDLRAYPEVGFHPNTNRTTVFFSTADLVYLLTHLGYKPYDLSMKEFRPKKDEDF